MVKYKKVREDSYTNVVMFNPIFEIGKVSIVTVKLVKYLLTVVKRGHLHRYLHSMDVVRGVLSLPLSSL